MMPFNWLEAIYGTIIFLWIAISYGGIVIYFFKRKILNSISLSALFCLILGIGISIITLLIIPLTIFGRLFNYEVILLIDIFISLIFIKLYFKRKYLLYIISHSSNIDFILIHLIIAIIIIHFLPTIGFYTPPADDPKFFSLITRRIIEEKGFVNSWGSYAYEDWIIEKFQLYMVGLPSLVAHLSLISGLSIPKAMIIITQVLTSLTALSIYFLARTILNDFVGFCAAFIYGLLIFEPNLTWITWGGNAELTAFFYMPIFLSQIWILINNKHIDFFTLLISSLFLSSMLITHPFPIIYSIAFIVSAILYLFIQDILRMRLKLIINNSLKRTFRIITCILIAICFSFPLFYEMLREEIHVMPYYEPSINPGWTPIFSYSQTITEALISLFNRFLIVYGLAFPLFFIIAFVYFFQRKFLSFNSRVIIMLIWYLILFLLHENNPNGLFVIRFPLWYRIDANRTFAATSFPLSIILATYISQMKTLCKWKKAIKNKYISIILALSFFIVFLIQPIITHIMNPLYAISEDDIKLFNFIEYYIGKNEKIFVFPNDAGQWIPIFTGRMVLIPMGVVTKHEFLNMYYLSIYPSISEDPLNPLVLEFLNKYNVTYIYIGGKIALQNIYPFIADYNKFLDSSPIYSLVWKEENAFLFRYNKAMIEKIYDIDINMPDGIWYGTSAYFNINDSIVSLKSAPNDWATLLKYLPERKIENHTYLKIVWKTEPPSSIFSLEGVTINGSVYKLFSSDTKSYFKWGNGSVDWVTTFIKLYGIKGNQTIRELRFLISSGNLKLKEVSLYRIANKINEKF
jgi:hypothetical protein